MYLDYWQLNQRPFDSHGVGEQPRLTEDQQAGLGKLRYAVESRAGGALLVGAAGVGKTLLIDQLQSELAHQFQPFTTVDFPHMSSRDLIAYLAERLGVASAETSSSSFEEHLRRLESALAENVKAGRHAVIVVDEAHVLEDGVLLEPLRLLMNIRVDRQPVLTLVLSGQPDLLTMVHRFGAFEQRIDLKVALPAFTPAESADYVRGRLQAAGATREIFTPEALDVVHNLSGGTPRRINRLCDLALLVGFASRQPSIGADQLYAVDEELVQLGRCAA